MADETAAAQPGIIDTFMSGLKSTLSGAANIFGEVRAMRMAQQARRDAALSDFAIKAAIQNPELLNDPAFGKTIENTMGKGTMEMLGPVLGAMAKHSAPQRQLEDAAQSQVLGPVEDQTAQMSRPPSSSEIMQRVEQSPATAMLASGSKDLGTLVAETLHSKSTLAAALAKAGKPIISEVKDGDQVHTVQIGTDENGNVVTSPLFSGPRWKPGGNKPFATTTNNLALLQLGLTPEDIQSGKIPSDKAKQAQQMVKERRDTLRENAVKAAGLLRQNKPLPPELANIFGGLDEADVRRIGLGGMNAEEFLAALMSGEFQSGQSGAPPSKMIPPAASAAPKVLSVKPVGK